MRRTRCRPPEASASTCDSGCSRYGKSIGGCAARTPRGGGSAGAGAETPRVFDSRDAADAGLRTRRDATGLSKPGARRRSMATEGCGADTRVQHALAPVIGMGVRPERIKGARKSPGLCIKNIAVGVEKTAETRRRSLAQREEREKAAAGNHSRPRVMGGRLSKRDLRSTESGSTSPWSQSATHCG